MTLQELLHARVGNDPRAHVAALETRAGAVRILFGDVGGHHRVILGVEGNHVSILYPSDMPQAAPKIDDGPVEFELTGGLKVELRDGVLFAGETALFVSDADPQVAIDRIAQLEADLAAVNVEQKPSANGENAPEGSATAESDPPAGDGAQSQPEGSAKIEPTDPDKYNKPSLIALAESTPGVVFDANDTKAAIAAAIDKARGL